MLSTTYWAILITILLSTVHAIHLLCVFAYFIAPFRTVSPGCLSTWQITHAVGAGTPGVGLHWHSYVWAGVCRVDSMSWPWDSLGIHVLHSQHYHGSSVSPSSHCTAVVAHGFNYQCFHFQLSHLSYLCWFCFGYTFILQMVSRRPEWGNELPKDTQEFYGKVTETLKHINYLSNLLFKWGFMHRRRWSAEQWKLEPVNLLTQSNAMCSQRLISSLTSVCWPYVVPTLIDLGFSRVHELGPQPHEEVVRL